MRDGYTRREHGLSHHHTARRGARAVAARRDGGDMLRAGAAALALLALGAVALAPQARAAGPDKSVHATTTLRMERAQNFSPIGSYLAGRIAQNAGDWTAAAEHLQKALTADPDNAALVRRTFLLSLGEGRYEEALTLARRIGEMETDSFLADTLLIAEALEQGKVREAEQLTRALPTDGLGQFVTPLLKAWVLVADGRHGEAVAVLDPLDQSAGFKPLKALQSALIEDMAGRPDEARELYKQAAQTGQALRLIQLTGNFLERQGQGDAARALYTAHGGEDGAFAKDLARLDRGTVPAPIVRTAKDGLAEAMFDLAAALHQEGAAEMALLYGRVSLMLDPDKPLVRLMMGDVLASRQRHDAALEEYRAVGGSAAVAWTARLREADALRRLDREAEAATLLTAMAAERPDHADPLVRLGDIERMGERFDAAIAAYDKAVERLAAAERDDWVVHYVRAIALDAAKRWPEAERDLKRALELKPDQPSVLNYLGYSYVDRGVNLQDGLEMIERAVAQRPEDGYIVDSLGWAKYKLGDFHGAIEHLERAVELQPTDPTINDHLGDAYWAVGRKQEARFQWTRAAQQEDADEELRASVADKLKNGLSLPKTAELPAGR